MLLSNEILKSEIAKRLEGQEKTDPPVEYGFVERETRSNGEVTRDDCREG